MEGKLKFAVTVVLVAALSFSLGYASHHAWLWTHQNPRVSVNVYVFRERPGGVDLVAQGNVMTDFFENMVCNIFGFDNVTNINATKWIALGNSTISQSKTKLDTEATASGFGRAEASVVKWMNGGDHAVNYTKKFTATGTIWVNATALHESGTANAADAVALASLGGYEKFESNWNCTIVWVVTYDFN